MEELAPLEDACTVVLLRDGDAGLETLMLERPKSSRAFGGAWVFPGGKVDAEDRVAGTGGSTNELAAAVRAGLREVAEETGQQLRGSDLVWLSQWTPLQSLPRRFRTWFMLAAAVSTTVVLNPHEHSRYAWLTPAEALARHGRGEIMLVPPTWVTLHHLAGLDNVSQALADTKANKPFEYETHLLPSDSGTAAESPLRGVMWPGDGAYPSLQHTAPGARHRLLTAALPWSFEHTIG
ncbi:8-oxo-dGTP pyrophosphatase MutT, NUDIX family [Arthrobacter alpinus]|uniref:8-oxo-dGTP pyrophosphatase MutT, NUDIX family n=1 Tax=Arthrobacter alpinus TaxID=656366 RepID=A0A1H5NNF1_9MICC|nr:NUDIX hydrolase [Arthrobacter alpinus]SEF03115.1 8-oxo-dGTP pyrophosphatase MutT, NUDIX family [Arthrobacter alpinus]